MAEKKGQGKYVFGLDIGTRSIVGTVGYKEGDIFTVVAQEVREHETRAMIDGQIHNIGQVGNTISVVKKSLESKLDIELSDVCIAAAGRVLRTVETSVTKEYEKETEVNREEIVSLISMAVEKAYQNFQENNDTDIKFYCVGNSVIRYYMNGYQIGNLENHKARSIGVDMIATFLPDDVVDGLYKAVELADLSVVNMTLEPIAAISVAIPEAYRMLNIALVDVGAGTSDICITKDGCIVAYGMIPIAGDSLTEIIASNCLVDFATAESIKRGISEKDIVEYSDIMLLPQTIDKTAVLAMLEESVESMTQQVADKIMELNGGKAVSAVFVVGGGGKIDGYTDKLAKKLGIITQRVALRGEEVMQKINFLEETKKDSLLVTPIGICLNYYEQSNNFIYVKFNNQRIKLYDNSSLAIVDAAMHAGYPNEYLFPRRGKEINYTLNNISKICRGELGEPAIITLNGEETDIYHEIRANDIIVVKESTAGKDAVLPLAKIPGLKASITVKVNGSKILLPKFSLVNRELRSMYYEVQNGDRIELLDYYTVKQVKDFMDVILNDDTLITVNNEPADDDTLVYDNFSIRWDLKKENVAKNSNDNTAERDTDVNFEDISDDFTDDNGNVSVSDDDEASDFNDVDDLSDNTSDDITLNETNSDTSPSPVSNDVSAAEEKSEKAHARINVIVNNKTVELIGKSSYVFVDVFDYIDFDRTTVMGKSLVTTVNGKPAEFMQTLFEGDIIEIFWEK